MGGRFTGDWNLFETMRQRVSRNHQPFSESLGGSLSNHYLKVVNELVQQQDAYRYGSGQQFGGRKWFITADWEKRKLPENRDKAWINTDKFLKLLEVRRPARDVYFAGAPADKPYNDEVTVADIAKWGEYGDREREPNPLFGPARIKTMQDAIDSGFLDKEVGKMLTQDYSRNDSIPIPKTGE